MLRIVIVACVFGFGPVLAAPSIDSLLVEQRSEIALRDGTLSGPCAERLIQKARAAQFVVLGEDHGFADVPELAMALNDALGAAAFAYHAVEAGPFATQAFAAAASEGEPELEEWSRRYPFALPFLVQREDAKLAQTFVQRGGAAALWGIDQEFILSLRLLLDNLDQDADEVQRAALAPLRERASVAETAMREQHDPSHMLLPQLLPAEFAALAKAFPGKHSALAMIAALDQSADIYRRQDSDGYSSNRARSLLMKRQFMAHYRRAQAAGVSTPRVLLKLGAFHAGRGLSPTRHYDIGNFVSELAEGGAQQSLHVLVVAMGGTVNQWLPFVDDQKLKMAPYDATEASQLLGLKAAFDAAFKEQWSYFDLTALRRAGALLDAADPTFKRTVFSYDALVVIPAARAATHF